MADAAPQRQKPGPKPGSPKSGGRGHYRPPDDLPKMSAQQKREWLWSIGGNQVLENRVRRALGKSVWSRGHGGKQYWRETSAEEQAKAEEWVVNRLIPPLSGVQISGDRDNPVAIEANRATGLAEKDHELARRLALALRVGGVEAPAEPADEVPDGRPIGQANGHNGAQRVLSAPGPVVEAEVEPVIGETFEVKDGVSIVRLSHDGRSDGGGNWRVERDGKELRVVKGVTQAGAVAVAEALVEELGSD